MKKTALTTIFSAIMLITALCICPIAGADAYSGSCGDNTYYSFDPATGSLEISGSGIITEMKNYTLYPWGGYREAIKALTIGEDITFIGEDALTGLTNLEALYWNGKNVADSYGVIHNMGINTENGTAVIFGDKVEHIPRSLLSGTSSSVQKLASVTLSDSIRSVGISAFYNCKDVPITGKLPNAEVIGAYAFYYCTGLGEMDLSKVKHIENNAFQYSSISGAIDLSNIVALEKYAFGSCKSITELTIGEGLKTYEGYCFSGADLDVLYWNVRTLRDFTREEYGIGMSHIKKLVFGDTVEYIPARMCAYSVDEVVFSDSILEVGN